MSEENKITFIAEGGELLRISKDGISANPDVPVDEAAQKVLAALSENIKIMIDRAVQDSKREWIGLTQEELQDLCVKSYQTDNAGETHFNRGYFADAIEAKLKEKNT